MIAFGNVRSILIERIALALHFLAKPAAMTTACFARLDEAQIPLGARLLRRETKRSVSVPFLGSVFLDDSWFFLVEWEPPRAVVHDRLHTVGTLGDTGGRSFVEVVFGIFVNIIPFYFDVIVSVRSTMGVIEASGMKKFVHHRAFAGRVL